MKRLIMTLVLASMTFTVACEKKETDAAKAEAPAATKEETKEEGAAAPKDSPTSQAVEKEGDKAPEGEKLAMVEVSKEGTKFDPPVKPEQIPAGAWYCDMGTVEYARMEKGDGKCPECGMFLKQKTGDAPAAPEAKKDDHGHDHGEGGHDHAH